MEKLSASPAQGPTALPDDALMAAVAAGQDAALAVLYDRYGRLVFSLAVSVLGDTSQAEEVIQDVFIQVWNKAETYNAEQGRVVTWLAAIARHRAIDYLRRRGVRPQASAADWDVGYLADLPD
jgi:RNA polymerase sigma-70 factor (ECF subfamily)